MKIMLIWPGKTKNRHLKALTDDYCKRIRRFMKLEIVEIPDRSLKSKSAEEEEKILAHIPKKAYIILLDDSGKEFTSEGFAKKIAKLMTSGRNLIVFIVCSESGSTKRLQDIADMILSFTRFTVTHEIARMLLTEQIYRSLTIIHNHPYHK